MCHSRRDYLPRGRGTHSLGQKELEAHHRKDPQQAVLFAGQVASVVPVRVGDFVALARTGYWQGRAYLEGQ